MHIKKKTAVICFFMTTKGGHGTAEVSLGLYKSIQGNKKLFEFKENKNMQLLIHPIWWFVSGKSNTEKIKKYYYSRVNNLKNDFSSNSNPFKEIHDEIN